MGQVKVGPGTQAEGRSRKSRERQCGMEEGCAVRRIGSRAVGTAGGRSGGTVSRGRVECGLEGSEGLPMGPGLRLTSFWVEMPSTVRVQDGGNLENLGVLHTGRKAWSEDLRAVRLARGAWVWPGWQEERACPQAWRWRPGRGRIQRDG